MRAIAKLADDIRAFIAMDQALRAQGFSAPRILAHNVADGLAILEDIGAQYIADADGPNAVRYTEAVSLLAELHGRTLPRELPVDDEIYAIPTYDADAMLIEVELLLDWYAPHVAKVAPASGARAQFHGLWREALGADPRAAGQLDLARFPFAQPALAARTRRAETPRAGRFPGQRARAARL